MHYYAIMSLLYQRHKMSYNMTDKMTITLFIMSIISETIYCPTKVVIVPGLMGQKLQTNWMKELTGSEGIPQQGVTVCILTSLYI